VRLKSIKECKKLHGSFPQRSSVTSQLMKSVNCTKKSVGDLDPDPHILGLQDPDLLVLGMDPDPAPDLDPPLSHKVVELTEIMLAIK
jgi:hypothetical protein